MMGYDFILIGITSGGPKALYSIIEKFDESFNLPVIILQNLPVGFDKIFCEVFAEKAKLPIEIVDKETTLENKIYLSKAGHILSINENKHIIITNYRYQENCISEFIKNCIKQKFKPIIVCLSGVLTKNDPLEGLKIAKENDIPIIVQKIDDDPNLTLRNETSLPEAIIKKNYYTSIIKLNDIPQAILEIIEKNEDKK
jgi:two-component system chemotaxis response regulator CheB